MINRNAILSQLVALALLTLAGCSKETPVAQNDPPPVNAVTPDSEETQPKTPHNPLEDLSAEDSEAWKAAGVTQIGWMSLSQWGSVGVIPESYATADDLPSFVLDNGCVEGVQETLPDPGFKFGIAISKSKTSPDPLGPFLDHVPVENCHALKLWGDVATTQSALKLKRLKNLHALTLSEAHNPDEILVVIGELKQLVSLEVSSVNKSELTDAGLAELEGLHNLEVLCVRGAKVTASGIGVLSSLQRLQGLNLSRTNIGIRGIDELVELQNLKYLDVRSTGIRDEAGQLIRMTQLKELHLERSFDKDELDKLQKALPHCEIVLQ